MELSDPGLHEASANFDLEHIGPFLTKLVGYVEGFEISDVAHIAGEAASLDVDSEQEWQYSVRVGGLQSPLRIRVFMDDIEAPDLYIFAVEPLIAKVNEAMEEFFEESGP